MKKVIQNFIKKIFLGKKLTTIALLCLLVSMQTSQSMFLYDAYKNIESKFIEAKEAYVAAKKCAKIAGYTVGGLLAYKRMLKPLSKIIFGARVKPTLRTVDRVLNLGILAGGIAGILFLCKKFSSPKKVLKEISKAKDDIITNTNDKTKEVKTHVSDRADKTDKKVAKGFDDTKKKIETVDNRVKNGFTATKNKLSKMDNHIEQRFDKVDNILLQILDSITIVKKDLFPDGVETPNQSVQKHNTQKHNTQ